MATTRNAGPIGGLILGVIFAVVGYFVAYTFGKPILDNAKASDDWPSVKGTITRSAVSKRRSSGKTQYSFDVVYKYKVEGNEFSSSNVYFGGEGSSSSSSSAYKVTGRYPKGTEVDVFYEPENPGNAVLEPGAHWQSYLVYGVGMIFLVIGVLAAGSSIFTLFFAGAVIFGAASGLLGGKSDSPQPQYSGGSTGNAPSDIDLPDEEDDGFDI